MTGRPVQTQRSSHPRARLVLLLLVGLLGMHGLASQHSTAAMADPTASTTSTAGSMTGSMTGSMPVSALDHGSTATSAAAAGPDAALDAALDASTVAPIAARSLLLTSDQTGGGMAMADLCLAVLASALLLLRAATVHADRTPRTACPARRLLAQISTRPPPGPPDLVAGLCVSRT